MGQTYNYIKGLIALIIFDTAHEQKILLISLSNVVIIILGIIINSLQFSLYSSRYLRREASKLIRQVIQGKNLEKSRNEKDENGRVLLK